jgi:hypothetical protein
MAVISPTPPEGPGVQRDEELARGEVELLPARAKLLSMASKAAAGMEKERMGWASPLAGLLRAGLAAVEGDAATARSHLSRSSEALEACRMPVLAAAARARLQRVGGSSEASEDALRTIGELGAADPAALVDLFAPFPA